MKSTTTRLLWAGVAFLLAINLGLLAWLWFFAPATHPVEATRPAKFVSSAAGLPRRPLEAPPLAKTDRLAMLVENARRSLRTEPDAKALAVMRNSIANRFAPLFRLLDLDEAGLAQLEPLLLTRQQLQEMARQAVLAAGVIPTPEELWAAERFATELVDAQIAATLGPAKAAIFSGFVLHSADYRAVDALSAKLSYTDQPLKSETRRTLCAALVATADQPEFLVRAGEILDSRQMEALLKSYEAREASRLRSQLLQEAMTGPAP